MSTPWRRVGGNCLNWNLEALAASVFAATFLLLALGRIGGQALPRGAVALVGGLVTKRLLGISWRVIDVQILLLLAGLMALAGLAESAGLFAGIRRRLIHRSPGMALWLSTLLVAATSAALLNDAAVVILVPFLLPALLALGLPGVASVVLLAIAANVGSLLTPFGNPQNAVLARAAHLDAWSFIQHQGLLVLVGVGLLAAASWWVARHVSAATIPAPAPAVARGRPWLVSCIAGFLVAAVVGPWALGTVAVAAALFAYLGLRPVLGREADRAAWRGIDLNVLALFVGLYLLTGGIPVWLPASAWSGTALDGPMAATLFVTALSNLIGNVPAILTLLRVDPEWTVRHAHFLVSVSTLGGALLLTGSAASLIAADQARRLGIDVRFVPFLRTAVPWVLPLLLAAVVLNWPLLAAA